jgi:2-keto-3-deoxy-L-rhamnonate aldolase RhmA
VVSAIERIEDAVRQAGKPFGTIILPDQERAVLRDRGCKLLIAGSDVATLRAAFLEQHKKLLALKQAPPPSPQRTPTA